MEFLPMQTLLQFLDFLVAHPAYQLILNWFILYEALLPRAEELPPPFSLGWSLRWHLWFALCADHPQLWGTSRSWIAQPATRVRTHRVEGVDPAPAIESLRSLASEPATALGLLDARLGSLHELRKLLSQAIAETRTLRRTVAHQRKFRPQELVVARYAAIYQYIQLSQPEFPLGRLLADERLRAFTCGCPEGACQHVEYLSKRLTPLSNRSSGRPRSVQSTEVRSS
jgi:hypothetical protein